MGEDDSVELAKWLQEAGRRRSPARVPCDLRVSEPRKRAPRGWLFKNAVLLVAGAVAAIQYAYADAMVQILSIRSVIVFIFTGDSAH